MKKDYNEHNDRLKAQNGTYFLALSIGIKKTEKGFMKKHLKEKVKEAFSHWIKNQSIQDIAIYHYEKTAEKEGEFTPWNCLILLQLKDQAKAAQMEADFKKIKLPFLFETIRTELLVTTNESTYPTPGKKASKRKTKPFYAVEYVEVKEPYLQEFQTIMIKNNGPAMRYIMENRKWCYNFYALETIRVFYHNDTYPVWNQIHVIGLYLESVFCYKRDFSKGLMLANHISFEENFKRLKQIRTMRFKSVGRKLR